MRCRQHPRRVGIAADNLLVEQSGEGDPCGVGDEEGSGRLVDFARLEDVSENDGLQRNDVGERPGRQVFAKEDPGPLGIGEELRHPQAEGGSAFR